MKSLSLTKPHMLIMTGIPSSGKSFFATKFSETFGAPTVDYHHIQQLVADEQMAENVTSYILRELMKTRQSILVEGKTDTRRDRLALARIARDSGYEPLYIWVQTDTLAAETRAARAGKAKTNRIMPAADHKALVKRFAPLSTAETHVVISGKHTYATQAKIVLSRLSGPRVEQSHQTRPPERPSSPTPGARSITIG